MRGERFSYAAGGWCEREAGHEGPHVIAPLVPAADWDKALTVVDLSAEGEPK